MPGENPAAQAVVTSTSLKVLLIASGACLLGAAAFWIWRRRRYGSLSGVVSFSARIIAAGRAVETEAEQPLFQDFLAAELAGPDALRDARASQTGDAVLPRKVGNIAIRTKWFDDCIESALSPTDTVTVLLKVSEDGACSVFLKVEAALPPVRQIVLLGAGMDTRPWRMQLPPGVRWIEVDQPDVLKAKRSTLHSLGAQLSHDLPPSDVAPESGNSSPAHVGPLQLIWRKLSQILGMGTGHAAGYRFPLRAAHWATVVADLSKPGLIQQLVEQGGFDPEQPAVWVAEGLLMYLDESAVRQLLITIALNCSGPSSKLVCLVLSEEALQKCLDSEFELLRSMRSGVSHNAVPSWLQYCGWKVKQNASRREFAHRYEKAGVRKYVGHGWGELDPEYWDSNSFFVEAHLDTS